MICWSYQQENVRWVNWSGTGETTLLNTLNISCPCLKNTNSVKARIVHIHILATQFINSQLNLHLTTFAWPHLIKFLSFLRALKQTVSVWLVSNCCWLFCIMKNLNIFVMFRNIYKSIMFIHTDTNSGDLLAVTKCEKNCGWRYSANALSCEWDRTWQNENHTSGLESSSASLKKTENIHLVDAVAPDKTLATGFAIRNLRFFCIYSCLMQ